MAELQLDLESTAADSLTGSWTDVVGLSGSFVVAGTGSLVILAAMIPILLTGTDDQCANFRFTIDGSPTGSPVRPAFKDNVDEANSCTLVWMVDGLSAASHTFAVQGINLSGTVDIDTARVRLLQAIEILTGASLVVDIGSVSSDASTGSWADIDAMAATITAVSGRAYLMNFCGSTDHATSGDDSADHSFAVDGVREGMVLHNHKDNTSEADGVTLVHVATGLSGSTDLSVQWITRNAATNTSTADNRVFQVAELEAEIFNLLTDIVSVSAGAAPSETDGWEDVPDLSDTPVVTAGSLILKMFGMQALRTGGGGDVSVLYRLTTGGAHVGAEVTQFGDASTRLPGQTLLHAETGLSGSTTFAPQWTTIDLGNDLPSTNETLNREHQVLELLPAAGAPPPFLPVYIRRSRLLPRLTR